ncbi:MAG: 16S rRNA (uracil(1498)-N(3))-methyltransferase [Saprospiraceae bacterium]|nr:16S rRNA (uracil(1498)-N(3))-methyltransferase [Lewinella sp.]
MQLFYVPDSAADIIELPPDEARHCVQVLRRRKGDVIHWVDGKGGWYSGTIVDAGKKTCQVIVDSARHEYGKRPFRLHLAVAPTKQIDRMEWLLEKAAEIGVDEITLLLCAHSERKQVRLDRLEKILVSAMKQSLKAYLPQLNDLTRFPDFIRQNNSAQQSFIAYVDTDQTQHLKDLCLPGRDVCLLIGPEGDFHPEEVRTALAAGCRQVSLGPSRLRTETAGMVGCAIINLVNQ